MSVSERHRERARQRAHQRAERERARRQRTREKNATPVSVLGEPLWAAQQPLTEIWWRSRQWAVTAFGIEDLTGGYPIEKDRLLEDLPAWSWPQHMAEKDWVNVDEFITAWLVALALHGVRADGAMVRKAIASAVRLSIERDAGAQGGAS